MAAFDDDRQTASMLTSRLRESAGKEGVYYVVRFPTRRRLYAFPWEDFGDLWEGDVWRRYVIADLADAWAAQLNIQPDALKKQLAPWPKGFPRGRVERAGVEQYTVFHGDDLADTGVSPERIERAFELVNSAVSWSLDPHERQIPEHQQALNRILA